MSPTTTMSCIQRAVYGGNIFPYIDCDEGTTVLEGHTFSCHNVRQRYWRLVIFLVDDGDTFGTIHRFQRTAPFMSPTFSLDHKEQQLGSPHMELVNKTVDRSSSSSLTLYNQILGNAKRVVEIMGPPLTPFNKYLAG